MTQTAAKEKKAPSKKVTPAPKASSGETEYVILIAQGGGAFSPFQKNGKPVVVAGSPGRTAIKKATEKSDGSYESGTFKAIPRSTWEAEGNNLTIRTETKPVSSFS